MILPYNVSSFLVMLFSLKLNVFFNCTSSLFLNLNSQVSFLHDPTDTPSVTQFKHRLNNTRRGHQESNIDRNPDQEPPLEPNPSPLLRRSTCISRPPDYLSFFTTLSAVLIPNVYFQARKHECRQKAMQNELELGSLHQNPP